MKLLIGILASGMFLIGVTITAGLIPPVSAAYMLNRVSSGKIAYDTFSASNGASTDISWTFNDEGWMVEDGKLKAGEGGGHPTGINVTDCIWEGKIKPMKLVVEGPQMTFTGSDGSHAAFDYYHIGHRLRVMIGPEGSSSVFQTSSFTMSTSTSHTMKVAVSNYNMRCYMDGALIFNVTDTNVTPVPSIPWTGGLHPIRDGDLAYWDDIKIWKSNKITVTNLVQGQRVELFDASDSLVSSATAEAGKNNAALDVSALSFPFEGYFEIYADDGTTLLATTPFYADIWGGDEYSCSVSELDTVPPKADAGLDQTVKEDTLVNFDGSNSSDNFGIVSYRWAFSDGVPRTLTGRTPTYTFLTPGNYIVTLNVSDAAGNWAIDTVLITVQTQENNTEPFIETPFGIGIISIGLITGLIIGSFGIWKIAKKKKKITAPQEEKKAIIKIKEIPRPSETPPKSPTVRARAEEKKAKITQKTIVVSILVAIVAFAGSYVFVSWMLSTPETYTKTFRIEVESDTSWSGSFGSVEEGQRTIEGYGGHSVSFKGTICSACVQKQTEYGYLTVSIYIGTSLKATQTTTASYGVVTVSASIY